MRIKTKWSHNRVYKIGERSVNAYSGNDTWENIDIPLEKIATNWGDENEPQKNDVLDTQLPDTRKKNNRIDRKIILCLIQNPQIIAFIHENPNDFNKIDLTKISDKKIIDLFNQEVDEVKQILLNL